MGFFENVFGGPSADKKIEEKIQEFKQKGIIEYTPEEIEKARETTRAREMGFMQKVYDTARPAMNAAIVAGALNFGAPKAPEVGGTHVDKIAAVATEEKGSASAAERISPKFVTKAEGEKGSLLPDDLDIHFSSPVKEKGKVRTFQFVRDWWKIGVPGFVEAFWNRKAELKTTSNVPYEYARQFAEDPKSGDPLHMGDVSRMAEHIKEEMQGSLADQFFTTFIAPETARGVYDAHHEPVNPQGLHVKTIKVTGFASPEARGTGGMETSAKQNQENIDLAKRRGETGMEATKQALKGMGFTDEQIKGAMEEVHGEVAMLSGEEIKELAEASRGYPGASVAEQVMNLVMDYNGNKIKDPQKLALMDRIYGEKRRITVEVEYDGNRKNVASIPIPLFLLALLTPFIRRRPRNEEPLNPEPDSSNNGLNSDGNLPKNPAPSIVSPEAITPGFQKPQISDLIRHTGLPPIGTPEYEEMEEEAIANDLYIFFHRGGHDEVGFGYQTIAESLRINYAQFANDGERIDYLALIILRGWQETDTATRRRLGLAEDGLDYENQPEQIKWAKMHAAGLLDVVQARIKVLEEREKDRQEGHYGYQPRGYSSLLEDKVWILKERRAKAGRPDFTRLGAK